MNALRTASDDDMRAIRQWLEREDAAHVHGNFLCNWSVIEAAHKAGEVLVYLDDRGAPAGYLTGTFGPDTILQVRDDVRGNGIGTRLVNACVESIERSGEPNGLAFIQCAPEDSTAFWARVGFTILASPRGSVYAYRSIRQEHPLPPNNRAVSVAVVTYPEHREWKPDTPPERTDQPTARIRTDGVVELGERVYILGLLPHHSSQDALVQIIVDGTAIYCDKAKRADAAKFGVQRCRHGFYLDVIDTHGLGRSKG